MALSTGDVHCCLCSRSLECVSCRYDFLGKDSEKPEHANGSAAPGKSSDERRPKEHRSSKDRDGTRDKHRDKERDRGEDGDRRDGHRSSSRDHRSHKSSRHRDERDHRSSRDRERPRDDPRDRHREDPRGQEAFKRPRTQEFLPRPPPPRFVQQVLCTPVVLCCKLLLYAYRAMADWNTKQRSSAVCACLSAPCYQQTGCVKYVLVRNRPSLQAVLGSSLTLVDPTFLRLDVQRLHHAGCRSLVLLLNMWHVQQSCFTASPAVRRSA